MAGRGGGRHLEIRFDRRRQAALPGVGMSSIDPLLEIDGQIEEDEASLFDIHHQGGPMVDAVVHIAGDSTPQVTLARVLRGLEIPVPVVPRQEHRLPQSFLRDPRRLCHGGPVIYQGRCWGELDPLDPAPVDGGWYGAGGLRFSLVIHVGCSTASRERDSPGPTASGCDSSGGLADRF